MMQTANATQALDHVGGGVPAPEPVPGSLWPLCSGVPGLLAWRQRAASA
jgi:hypothetical protein